MPPAIDRASAVAMTIRILFLGQGRIAPRMKNNPLTSIAPVIQGMPAPQLKNR